MWPAHNGRNTELRQFGDRLGQEIYRKIEDHKLNLDKLRDYSADEIGKVFRIHINLLKTIV